MTNGTESDTADAEQKPRVQEFTRGRKGIRQRAHFDDVVAHQASVRGRKLIQKSQRASRRKERSGRTVRANAWRMRARPRRISPGAHPRGDARSPLCKLPAHV